MNPLLKHSPTLITLLAITGVIIASPIAQLPHYHEFADHSRVLGIPHTADVLSNLGFLIVGFWGWVQLKAQTKHPQLAAGWMGYRLFLFALMLTAAGSSFYHWAPDNFRLVFDRLPITLACVGLLVGVRGETVGGSQRAYACLMVLYAIFSVGWWYATLQNGADDLGPYLILQTLPLVLVPLWQTIYQAPRSDKQAFAIALGFYVVAKVAELNDNAILDRLSVVSGHTLKHLLAALAAGIIVFRLVKRTKENPVNTLKSASSGLN